MWACLPLTVVLAGCDITIGPSLRGNGVAKTETRAIADFSEVEVGSAIELDVTIGPEKNGLVVTADENILPHVRTVAAGDRLKIYLDSPYSTNIGVKVQATTPQLSALLGSGASTTTVSGITGEQFELELSGASRCHLTGDTDRIEVTLSGASHGKIIGTTKQLTVECSGASQLDAKELSTEAVSADLSGASTAQVQASEELTADASGASTLRYTGQPGRLEKRTSGASTVTAE
jgi:hypothetical protein